MSEIRILDYFPIIMSRDAEALKRIGEHPLIEGSLVVLPQDAILIKPAPKRGENDESQL